MLGMFLSLHRIYLHYYVQHGGFLRYIAAKACCDEYDTASKIRMADRMKARKSQVKAYEMYQWIFPHFGFRAPKIEVCGRFGFSMEFRVQ